MPVQKKKHIGLWLTLVGLYMGIAYFLFPKTPAIIVFSLVMMFLLLLHPILNFWWIEETRERKIGACICHVLLLVVLGYFAWPPTVAKELKQESGISSKPFNQLSNPAKIRTKIIYQTKHDKVFVPQTTHSRSEQPDISLYIVNPSLISVMVVNKSNSIIRDAKYEMIAWDLELSKDDATEVKSLEVLREDENWLRPGDGTFPVGLTTIPRNANLVKKGDRLVGYATATCSNCVKSKTYWFYAVHGQGGWFAEIPGGLLPSPPKLMEALPAIRKNPDIFFGGIPVSKRIPIVAFP